MADAGHPPVADAKAGERAAMVNLIHRRGVADEHVLAAMSWAPRHLFIPKARRHLAYADQPVPIGYGQTISQPYIVAIMTEALQARPGDKVLEVGTGCGYQTAILAHMGLRVFSLEIVPELATAAWRRLRALRVRNVTVQVGDGYAGWPTAAPFRGILVAAAPAQVPRPLLEQLEVGGRMVVPVGTAQQQLEVWWRDGAGMHREILLGVRFVPMIDEVHPT